MAMSPLRHRPQKATEATLALGHPQHEPAGAISTSSYGQDEPSEAMSSLTYSQHEPAQAKSSLTNGQDKPAEIWLNRLLGHHLTGRARLPAHMGLPQSEYVALARRTGRKIGERAHVLRQQDALLAMLMRGRLRECHALADWLAQSMQPDAEPINRIIATACMGFNHLWQDLGLATRGELRELMQDCFPALVAANHSNMRWKKFFYRQICLLETGEVSCRSPSCDACRERESCFAPED